MDVSLSEWFADNRVDIDKKVEVHLVRHGYTHLSDITLMSRELFEHHFKDKLTEGEWLRIRQAYTVLSSTNVADDRKMPPRDQLSPYRVRSSKRKKTAAAEPCNSPSATNSSSIIELCSSFDNDTSILESESDCNPVITLTNSPDERDSVYQADMAGTPAITTVVCSRSATKHGDDEMLPVCKRFNHMGWTAIDSEFSEKRAAMQMAKTVGNYYWEHLKGSNTAKTYYKCLSHTNCLAHVMVKIESYDCWKVYKNGHEHSPNPTIGRPQRSDGRAMKGVWGAERAKALTIIREKGAGPRGIQARMMADIGQMTDDGDRMVAESRVPSASQLRSLTRQFHAGNRDDSVKTAGDLSAWVHNHLCLNDISLKSIVRSGNMRKLIVIAQPFTRIILVDEVDRLMNPVEDPFGKARKVEKSVQCIVFSTPTLMELVRKVHMSPEDALAVAVDTTYR